jgi:hypothetical protein
MIPENIINHINTPGQALSFGTTSIDLQPKVGRFFAIKSNEDKSSISFFVNKEMLEPHKKNLENTGKTAVNVTYPPTHISYQFKGKFLNLHEANGDEMEFVKKSFQAFCEMLAPFYGEESSKFMMEYSKGDFIVVTMSVEQIFDQTPGPGAGKMIYPNN